MAFAVRRFKRHTVEDSESFFKSALGKQQTRLPPALSAEDLDTERAALKIQRCWRGKQARKALQQRKKRARPWGFYTHSLVLTSCADRMSYGTEAPNGSVPRLKALHLLLEEPSSSQAAQVISICIIGSIILSIAGFVLETVQSVQKEIPDIFVALEVCCTGIFTTEYVCRLITCTEAGISRIVFVCMPMNIFDLAAVVPFYVELVLRSMGDTETPALRALRVVRLIRILRIFKLGRYASGMRLMGEALRNSSQAISVLVFLLLMGVVLFSSSLFYVEKLSCPELEKVNKTQYEIECADSFNRGWAPSYGLCCTEDDAPRDFPSIIAASWWSVVTMTSVGYGEVYPRTTLGKMVGTVAMLVGMVLIALPVAIVGQKFQDVYESHDLQETKERAAMRMTVMGQEWTLVPPSNVCHKLKKLRLKDPAFAKSVDVFACYLEEVWEQREQLTRERKFELEKQEDWYHKVGKLVSSMESSLESAFEDSSARSTIDLNR